GYVTKLVRMAPGAVLHPHRHAEAEESYVLEGDLWVSGVLMLAGDYCRAEAGSVHSEVHTSGGCAFIAVCWERDELHGGSRRRQGRARARCLVQRACVAALFLRQARMPRERRVVAVGYFLLFLGAGVWLPYFPLYLAHLGFRGWEIGILTGMQPALRWGS